MFLLMIFKSYVISCLSLCFCEFDVYSIVAEQQSYPSYDGDDDDDADDNDDDDEGLFKKILRSAISKAIRFLTSAENDDDDEEYNVDDDSHEYKACLTVVWITVTHFISLTYTIIYL